MTERRPGDSPDFRPKDTGPTYEEISEKQREVEAENEALRNAIEDLYQDPEALMKFVNEAKQVLTAMNMDIEFAKLNFSKGKGGVPISRTNSADGFRGIKAKLQNAAYKGK